MQKFKKIVEVDLILQKIATKESNDSEIEKDVKKNYNARLFLWNSSEQENIQRDPYF